MSKYNLKNMMMVVGLFLLFPIAVPVYAESSSVASATDDAKIITTIKAEYTKNPILDSFDISIKSHSGVVSLGGFVDTKIQHQRAVQIARDTAGVKKVDGKGLRVIISHESDIDKAIASQIVGQLVVAKLITSHDPTIAVEAKNGVVYLDGYVLSKSDLKSVIEIAKSTAGVKKVKDNLRVIKAK